MKKIIFMHPVDDLYGASRILAYVINSLDSNKYHCEIIVPCISGKLHTIITNPSVKFIEITYLPIIHRKMFTLVGLLKWTINNIKFGIYLRNKCNKSDLIYINTFANFSISFIARILSLNVITHCHEVLNNSFYGGFISFISRKCSDTVICVSKKVKDYVYKGDDDSVVLIYNGIPDLNKFVKKEYTPLECNENYNFFLIGRVMPEKGHWFLLNTIKKIEPIYLGKVKFHIFGDSPPNRMHLLDDFKNDVKQLGLESYFIFYGFVNDISDQLKNKCDVLLVPSIMEDPFPTTVLEGLRSGIPTITTNNGGAAEIIEDKINGFLIEPNNELMFLNVIVDILNEKMDLSKISSSARLSYEKQFSLSTFSKKISNVIDSSIK